MNSPKRKQRGVIEAAAVFLIVHLASLVGLLIAHQNVSHEDPAPVVAEVKAPTASPAQ